MFWGRPPLRGGARQPALPVECFTMSRLRPAGRRQPATINPPVPARKLWRCGAEAEIGEGEGKLSGESFPSPSPNPTPFPSKTFVNGAGGGSGGLAARALLEVPQIRHLLQEISPGYAGLFRWLSGRPASEFQPRSGIILICVGRSPVSGISDASLFLGLPDVAFCIRQQLVGVVPKGEWGRFSEPGISPDCAGWLRRLLGRLSASGFQPRSGIILICVCRPPASGISDASLFLGLPDVASCIRQQLVGVVPKDEWGRFSEPGISPDCAGWLRRLSGRPSASEFQPPQRHHPDLHGPSPCVWNFSLLCQCVLAPQWGRPCTRNFARRHMGWFHDVLLLALHPAFRRPFRHWKLIAAAVIGVAVFWGHVLFFRLLWRHRALINPRLSPVRDRHGRRA